MATRKAPAKKGSTAKRVPAKKLAVKSAGKKTAAKSAPAKKAPASSQATKSAATNPAPSTASVRRSSRDGAFALSDAAGQRMRHNGGELKRTSSARATERMIAVDKVSRSQVRALGRVVTDAREVTISKGLEQASIKGDVLSAIQRLTAALSRGASILVLDHEDNDLAAELSSQQVADLLNVSRPYVVKLARNGELPYRKVGNRHRFKVADILAYDQAAERVRDDALREIAPTGGYSAEDF